MSMVVCFFILFGFVNVGMIGLKQDRFASETKRCKGVEVTCKGSDYSDESWILT